MKIDFLFKSFDDVKGTIDDWIKRAWVQFPGNEELSYYAKRRNLEFNRFYENIVLDGESNVVKEVADDREVGNDVSNGVEDENVDDVPIDAEVDEAVVDGSPNGITQLLNDPNFCDQIEKEAYAQVASRSLEVSGLGEKSGKEIIEDGDDDDFEEEAVKACKVISQLRMLDPNVAYDDDFTTPIPAVPVSVSSGKVGETIVFSPVPIQSFDSGPSRPKRIVKPAAPLRSPYDKIPVDASQMIKRNDERVAGCIFLGVRDPRYYCFFNICFIL